MDSDSLACNNYYSHDLYSEPAPRVDGSIAATLVCAASALQGVSLGLFYGRRKLGAGNKRLRSRRTRWGFLARQRLDHVCCLGRFHAGWTDGGSFNTEPGTVGTGFRIYGGLFNFFGLYLEREIGFFTLGGWRGLWRKCGGHAGRASGTSSLGAVQ